MTEAIEKLFLRKGGDEMQCDLAGETDRGERVFYIICKRTYTRRKQRGRLCVVYIIHDGAELSVLLAGRWPTV